MLLIYPVIFVGIYFSVDDFSNFLTSRTLYIITPIFFIIDILPTLILRIQYLIANYNAILYIDTSQKLLIYSSPKKNVTYPFQEIKSLIYFNNYGNKTGFYSFADYKFFRIIFNDGNFINVTCLMMKNIKNELLQLLNIQSERNTQFLALINSKVFYKTPYLRKDVQWQRNEVWQCALAFCAALYKSISSYQLLYPCSTLRTLNHFSAFSLL